MIPPLPLVLLAAAVGPSAAGAGPPPVVELVDSEIDYGSFLGRLDPVWSWSSDKSAPPPDGWWNMGFTGNGMLAWMITAGANSSQPGDLGTLRLEVGRTDVTDDRMPGCVTAASTALVAARVGGWLVV
jgi:hypothetical protein